ncbi:MAG: methionine--tRNA ligase [Dehalococcoidia bacterium]|nr:MAG: methionine--tRNA ligase [Dehalococcoidia bacterium]
MSERILVAVAWPYANSRLHLGHVAGAYLPADIFARYHRVKGDEVIMVSGSDQHGTPVTIRAEAEGKTPAEVAENYHKLFLEDFERLGISWDLFTTTRTANHKQVSQDIFLRLLEKGYIYKQTVSQPWCEKCQRFLPDRYVEGACPLCKSPNARGDQCEQCGKPMNPADLVDARCRTCGTSPSYRESEHFFLKLSALEQPLLAWVKDQTHWRTNVLNFTTRYLEEGLHDRAITRDIDWGIPLPLPGYPGKRIYVWFEAVIGYLSASKEWAQRSGDKEAWRKFWEGGARGYYFIGKDNIPFHTIVWPAMLMGYGGLNLPYDVPANEFLTIESQKFSKSRNLAVWVSDYFERYDADPLRYLLSANMPETSDTDFSWREFVRRNNDELVATYGNLVQRVLTFTYTRFDGVVPTPGALDEASRALLDKAQDTIDVTDKHLYRCHFRDAIRAAMTLAQEANRYLDEKAPWKAIKTDKEAAATSLYVAIAVITALKTLMYPFIPFSSQKLHGYLGLAGKVEDCGWCLVMPEPGTKLNPPQVLFTKLDDAVIEEETRRMGLGAG